MNIAFFGSSLVSAYWNGAATYYRGLLRALAGRGYGITFLEPDAYGRQQNRDIADPSWATVVVYRPDAQGMEQALQRASAADVLVKASGVGVLDAELEVEIPRLRRGHQLAVYWDVDAPATLESLDRNPDAPLNAALPSYDLVLTYGGGERVRRAFLAKGAQAFAHIYNGLDTTTHFPVPHEARFAADLTFVGNRLPDRDERVGSFFFDAARRLPDRRFLLGGNGWDDVAVPANVRKLGHVRTGDHNAINCAATMVLNVNRDSMARFGYSPPTRIFEAAGAGACLVSDSWAGVETFFEPGSEILIAEDGRAVADFVARIGPAEAQRIGQAARRRALSEHSYDSRARVVDRLLRAASFSEAAQ